MSEGILGELAAMRQRFEDRQAGKHVPTREERLRDKHPGLQETWDKYQVMLKLCIEKEIE